MYNTTITLFNQYHSSLGNMWYPHVIKNCNLLIDKAAIVAKYGAESKDNAILNIRYSIGENGIIVSDKPYFPPIAWEHQTNDKLANSITFDSGKNYSFFMMGEYENAEPIMDDDFDGFFEYMKENYDFVFAITSVAQYSLIPYFEITGK